MAQSPHRHLTSGVVSMVMFAAGQRAELGTVRAPRLRHTVATQTLAAGGPLIESQLLGHRKALTTRDLMRRSSGSLFGNQARPWLGGTP